MGLISDKWKVSLWSDESPLEPDSDDGCSIVNILKSTEVYVKMVNFVL